METNQYREQLKERAQAKTFEAGMIPPRPRQLSYNNDLELGAFSPSKFTWAGEHRKCLTCRITDSKGPAGHTFKAMGLEFCLAKPVPLPGEIRESLEFAQWADNHVVSQFSTDQLAKVRKIADDAKTTQQQWEGRIPNKGQRRPPPFRTASLIRIMVNFGIGGG